MFLKPFQLNYIFIWTSVEISCMTHFAGPSQGGPGPQYPNYPQGQGQQYGGYRPTQPGPPQPPQQRPYGYDQVSYWAVRLRCCLLCVQTGLSTFHLKACFSFFLFQIHLLPPKYVRFMSLSGV